MWGAFGVFLEGLGGLKAARLEAGSRTCVAASNFCAIRTPCSSTGSSRLPWLKAKREQAMSTGLLRSSTRRWRRPTGLVIARSMQNCTGCAAKCCSSATPETRRQPRRPILPPSPSRANKAPAASNCARRSRWRSSINRPRRPVEAHAVLAPALEGFAPTPEMPEIAEAQALLAAVEETEEVKAVEGQRKRRLRLQVSYGNALFAARGYGASETMGAFKRAMTRPMATRMRPNDWPPTTVFGPAATFGASCRR